MKILSYNIYHDVNIKEDSPSYNVIEKWNLRKEYVLNVIKESDADIICLQEDLDNQIKYLMNDLDKEYSLIDFSENFKFPNKSSSARKTIIHKKNIQLIGFGKFWLSDTPNEISDSSDLKSLRYLPVTYAEMKNKNINKNFFIFNLHLNAWKENKELRVKYAELVLNKVKEINVNNLPVIISGDFNSNKKRDPKTLEIILKEFYTDKKLLDDKDHEYNSLLSQYPEKPRTNYDYVFISKELNIEKLNLLGDIAYFSKERNGYFYPSDHKALLAEISFLK